MCECVPATHRSMAKCYCWRDYTPYIPITSCSLTFLCLSLYLIFIFRLSIRHLLSYVVLFHHVSLSPFLILCFSWEALESGKGLNIRVNRVILHFDTPHIISPSISLHGEERGTFFLPAPPLLTLSPYLPVIMCCRWEGIAAAEIALYLPIPSFFLFIY